MEDKADKITIFVDNYKQADEIKFVDKDIADEFRNTNYLIGTPSIVQLSRDIKELIKAIRSLKTELDGE